MTLRPTGQFTHTVSLSQHNRDLPLINLIQASLGCGKVYERHLRCDYLVQNRGDMKTIVTFFTQYPMVSIKTLDFDDFARALALHGTDN